MCFTFSWWLCSRSAGLECYWCALVFFAELHWVWDCYKWVLSCIMLTIMGETKGRHKWRCRCGACTVPVTHSYTASFPSHGETPLLVVITCIPFGLWHFLSRVKCVLILWVLPFLLLAASRRHSRSTSALSTADSVGQSGEQALIAWIRFLNVVLFYAILTFAIMCISQHLACASHRCGAFCSVFVQRGFLFWVSFIGCF